MAVKLLKTEVSSLLENIDYEMVNELELEAKLLRSLRHRNIVLYHGTGEREMRLALLQRGLDSLINFFFFFTIFRFFLYFFLST